MKRWLVQLGVISLIVVACVETEQVSPVPEISYKSLELFFYYDTNLEQNFLAAELVFDFIDGDADLGIYQETMDSVSWNEDNYNVFLTPWEKIDSLYYPIELDTNNPPPWYTIFHDTKLDRVGQYKVIRGTINLDILDLPRYDSMRYSFFIRDRAGNDSNIEFTDNISTTVKIPEF